MTVPHLLGPTPPAVEEHGDEHEDAARELAEARADHFAAKHDWNRVERARAELTRSDVLVTLDGNGRKHRRQVNADERIVLQHDLDEQRVAIAKRLTKTRERLQAAQLAAANASLIAQLPDYDRLADRVAARRSEAETALARFVAACWNLRAAASAEETAARKLVAAAKAGLPEEADALTLVARHEVPCSLPGAPDGSAAWETRARPTRRLFDGRRAGLKLDDPTDIAWLGRLLAVGRKRGMRLLRDSGPPTLREAVRAQLENEAM
jgi:hypothetical protein